MTMPSLEMASTNDGLSFRKIFDVSGTKGRLPRVDTAYLKKTTSFRMYDKGLVEEGGDDESDSNKRSRHTKGSGKWTKGKWHDIKDTEECNIKR